MTDDWTLVATRILELGRRIEHLEEALARALDFPTVEERLAEIEG